MGVMVRELEPDDGPAVMAFFEGLSAETSYRRFFGPPSRSSLKHLSQPDGCRHVAVMAVEDGEIRAVASYHRLAAVEDAADFAVVVADDHQHQGLGSCVVRGLAKLARRRGIQRFTATVLADNRPALGFVRAVDPQARRRLDGTSVDVEIVLGPGGLDGAGQVVSVG